MRKTTGGLRGADERMGGERAALGRQPNVHGGPAARRPCRRMSEGCTGEIHWKREPPRRVPGRAVGVDDVVAVVEAGGCRLESVSYHTVGGTKVWRGVGQGRREGAYDRRSC